MDIALVIGDGAAPEMMRPAIRIASDAAQKKDNLILVWEDIPMGSSAFKLYGDTLPKGAIERVEAIGTLFFGGVDDPKFDNTVGMVMPETKPEARCVIQLRKKLGLSLVFQNRHGAIAEDFAKDAPTSKGLMACGAINPNTKAAMFANGAGTEPELADLDIANPIGCILAAAMMLRYIDAPKAASVIENAVMFVLGVGYRTADLVGPKGCDKSLLVGTRQMGELVSTAIAKM